jgi:GGDEF domain-containing protein
VRLLWGSALSVEQVLKEADTAMYRVKNRRKQDAA